MEPIKLKKPIQSFGKEVDELVFEREPNAGDCVKHDNVYTINKDGSIAPNCSAILRITEDCCNLSRLSLDKLSLADLTVITGVVMGFLGERG